MVDTEGPLMAVVLYGTTTPKASFLCMPTQSIAHTHTTHCRDKMRTKRPRVCSHKTFGILICSLIIRYETF